ncbi:hypothetical protein [Candidatus Mesenet endosymbiont of Agriotes lineatus]|uniref:hypothetical protein n=1 Tax=Candidatus Mesenet endosymbiont of Agriotes lineatus TaxID=3077948 RepID=UPI0030CE80E3
MSGQIIQKLTKKLMEGVKVDIPVVSPTQEVVGEVVTFLRKYSTNGTIPLAISTSLATFTLSYFIGFSLINTRNQSIHGYVIIASILSSLLILSLILNSWYRTIAKNEKTGNELLNSDLNKDGKGGIDKIKIILDFKEGRTLEYVVPVNLSRIDELRHQARESRYRILLLSIPIVMPTITLLAMLAASEFNIKNLYVDIPILILFFSIFLAKLGFTVCKAKENKMSDYTSLQFSNNDILFNFRSKSLKITVINEQFKKQDLDKKEDKKETENNEDECCSGTDLNEEEHGSPVTRSDSSDTMYSAVNAKRTSLITEDRQEESEESRPWFSGIGAKAGEALGKEIARPVGQAVCAIEKTCKDISKAAQGAEQMGRDVSELKAPIKQMCEDVSNATKQLKHTLRDVSKTAKQINQTSVHISKFFKRLESYFPSKNDNTYSNMLLEDILPILSFNLKGGKNCLDDTISNLVDGKVIVTYQKGSTLEFPTPTKKTGAMAEMSSFVGSYIEGLKVTVGKDGFILGKD